MPPSTGRESTPQGGLPLGLYRCAVGWASGIGWPPHRISLRLVARLLRLPLQGGVIPAVLTDDIIYTLDREHGLHPAQESGKEPCAGLKNHSPLEGESARPGRSPQSNRWGANTTPRE